MATNLPFCQMVRASGLAEPWTHSHEESKFDQFGWRCTTKESGFGISTLVGNYNEDRFDLKHRLKSKPLPSQVWPGSQQKVELSCLFTVYIIYILSLLVQSLMHQSSRGSNHIGQWSYKNPLYVALHTKHVGEEILPTPRLFSLILTSILIRCGFGISA